MSEIMSTFANRNNRKNISMCVIERTNRNITVRMTNARWNRLMELEEAYQTARAVVRAKKNTAKHE